jgi:hypothetical protein
MAVCIIGWAHSPFGRLDDTGIEALAVACCPGYVSILEREK